MKSLGSFEMYGINGGQWMPEENEDRSVGGGISSLFSNFLVMARITRESDRLGSYGSSGIKEPSFYSRDPVQCGYYQADHGYDWSDCGVRGRR